MEFFLFHKDRPKYTGKKWEMIQQTVWTNEWGSWQKECRLQDRKAKYDPGTGRATGWIG